LTGSGALNINASAPTSSLTLDASGNLGINTTSPQYPLDVQQRTNDDSYALQLRGYTTGGDGTRTVNMRAVSGNAGDWANLQFKAQQFIFTYQGGTERARIDSSGNLLVGRTDTAFTSGQPGMCVLPTQGITFTKTTSPNLGACMYLHRTFGAGTGNLVEFAYDTIVRGSISTNGTGVTYGTASDYRLKNSIAPMTGALAKVALLKPCTYKWNADGSDGEGFIAHELAEVCPQAVSGQKDAVDADGNPVYQGIDTSFLVATLTAAIQELKADLDATKAELAALKGQQ
jgi:hypothetical protein